MVICLILPSPADFSDLPESNPGEIMAFCSVLLRMGFTWHSLLPENRWALTPPFHPYRLLRGRGGGISLLHYPWSRLHRTLSGILPCEARTFLTCSLSSLQPRPPILLKLSYSTIKPPKCKDHTLKQLPPMNSRIREFLGISSPGIPRK